MKRLLPLLLLLPALANAQNARLALPDFTALSKKAAESVSITLDSSLLRMAGKFLDANNPDDAAVQEIIQGLQGIYVRSYTFDDDVDSKQELDSLSKQLIGPGWMRLVETHSRKNRADVDIYILNVGGKATGLALIASEPRKFTVVNIVGSIDLNKLHKLEGHLGVPSVDPPPASSDSK
jgi:hypothetical protein